MKKALLALPLVLLLGACASDTYTKEKGEVVSKEVDGGRYGDDYYVSVSYPVEGGKYAISQVDVGSQAEMDKYHVGETITVYVDTTDNSAGQITEK